MKYLKIFFIFFLAVTVSIYSQNKTKKGTQKTSGEEIIRTLPPPPDGVFIHLTSGSENPQSVLTALTMALSFAADKEVYVYLDVNAVNVVVNSTKSIEMPKFEASKILIDKLIAKGATVAVNQLCLEANNKTKFDLMKGVKIAEPEDLLNFTRGRILSLSY
jgi:predicted peroxiredoxin